MTVNTLERGAPALCCLEIGSRVRCRASNHPNDQEDWSMGEVIRPFRSSSSSSAKDGNEYKVRCDNGRIVTVRQGHNDDDRDNDDNRYIVQPVYSPGEWKRMQLEEFCDRVRDGGLETVDLRTPYGGKNHLYAMTTEDDDTYAELLGHALRSQSGRVTTVNLNADNIRQASRPRGIRALAAGLVHCSSLQTLGLYGFGDDDRDLLDCLLQQCAEAAAAAPSSTTNNKSCELELFECCLPHPDTLALAFSSPSWRGITLTNCHCRRTEDAVLPQQPLLPSLASAKHRGSLESVSFKFCSRGVVHLCLDLLSKHRTSTASNIKTLGVYNAGQRGGGARPNDYGNDQLCLASSLDRFLTSQGGSMERLVWVNNPSDALATETLLALVARHDVLASLELKGASINNAAAKRIRCLLESTERLQELRLPYQESYYAFEENGYNDIAAGLRRNKSLVRFGIFIRRKDPDVAGFEAILDAAAEHGTLRGLVLAAYRGESPELTRLQYERFALLAQRLPSMGSLRSLDLRGFQGMSDRVMDMLVRVGLQGNTSLWNLAWDRSKTSHGANQRAEESLRVNRWLDVLGPQLHHHHSATAAWPKKLDVSLWPQALAKVSHKPAALNKLISSCHPQLVSNTTNNRCSNEKVMML